MHKDIRGRETSNRSAHEIPALAWLQEQYFNLLCCFLLHPWTAHLLTVGMKRGSALSQKGPCLQTEILKLKAGIL